MIFGDLNLYIYNVYDVETEKKVIGVPRGQSLNHFSRKMGLGVWFIDGGSQNAGRFGEVEKLVRSDAPPGAIPRT